VVAVIAAISWPAAQQVELAQIGQEITLLKPRADAVLREQQEARQKVARAAVVARLRGGRPPLVAVIDELSRQVPDGSWLTSFSISGPDIVLEGVSPSAAAISLGLGRNPAFEAARFRSPISRDSVNGLEHFHLGLTIREVRQ
jgi:general secretion pathway protein L